MSRMSQFLIESQKENTQKKKQKLINLESRSDWHVLMLSYNIKLCFKNIKKNNQE